VNEIELSEFQVTLSDVVRAICQRPRVYTMHGTFGEVLAFLEGYTTGALLGSPQNTKFNRS